MNESNTDKRTVFTDALETLGTIIDRNQKRDAIHLAVIPVKAPEILHPGVHVSANGETKPPYVGIVDPFLLECVDKGEWFWLVIYPRQITSLRHVWEHPGIPDEQSLIPILTQKEKSMKWMENYANSFNKEIGYLEERDDTMVPPTNALELIEAASVYLKCYSDYLTKGALFEGKSVDNEFWDHYEIITGENVELEKRGNFFSCSC